MVSIDVRPTATSRLADIVLQVKPNCDFDAIWTLRALARGLVPDADLVER
jgi:formylmethanofuran dehydrogenase subunit B